MPAIVSSVIKDSIAEELEIELVQNHHNFVKDKMFLFSSPSGIKRLFPDEM